MTDVGGEKDAGDVCGVGKELANGKNRGCVCALNHAPDVDIALEVVVSTEWLREMTCWDAYSIVTGAHHTAITGNGHASHAHVILGNQLVRALVLAQVPDSNVTSAVTANQLALVRVDDYIIHRNTVGVVALYVAAPGIPDFDGAVLTRCHQPLGLAVECDASDVGRMAVKGENGVWVSRLDVVELHRVVTGGGEIAFVRRYAQAIDLRVGVWDGARANARQRFPEARSPNQHTIQA